MDRPLVAYKVTGGNAGAEVIPHMNWRGLFAFGTNASGGTSMVAVEWPGFRTTAYHSMGQTQETTKNWMGSLLEGQRDAGGQMYMRNRYYDPATGQFTQTDPIGLAGGLNTYGFAAGDPVSYDDPYGLAPIPLIVIGIWAMRGAPYVAAAGRLLMEAMDPNPDAGSALVSGGRAARRFIAQDLNRIGTRLNNGFEKLDLRHLQVARAEMRGMVNGWDHVTEVREAMGGIRNRIGELRRILGNQNLTEQERRVAQGLLRTASRALDTAEAYLR